MSRWLRMDCNAINHPKVAELDDSEFRFWIEALCHATDHGTDGAISRAWVLRIARRPIDMAERLVEVGLFDRAGDGYELHSFLEYQAPAEHFEAISEKRRAAARARWEGTPARTPRTRSENANDANHNANAMQSAMHMQSKRDANAMHENENENENKKPLTLAPKKTAVRDQEWRELMAALIAAVGGEHPKTKAEQGKYSQAVDELRRIGASPDEVAARAKKFTAAYSMPVTPPALVRNWGQLAARVRPERFGGAIVIGA